MAANPTASGLSSPAIVVPGTPHRNPAKPSSPTPAPPHPQTPQTPQLALQVGEWSILATYSPSSARLPGPQHPNIDRGSAGWVRTVPNTPADAAGGHGGGGGAVVDPPVVGVWGSGGRGRPLGEGEEQRNKDQGQHQQRRSVAVEPPRGLRSSRWADKAYDGNYGRYMDGDGSSGTGSGTGSGTVTGTGKPPQSALASSPMPGAGSHLRDGTRGAATAAAVRGNGPRGRGGIGADAVGYGGGTSSVVRDGDGGGYWGGGGGAGGNIMGRGLMLGDYSRVAQGRAAVVFPQEGQRVAGGGDRRVLGHNQGRFGSLGEVLGQVQGERQASAGASVQGSGVRNRDGEMHDGSPWGGAGSQPATTFDRILDTVIQ